MSLPDAVSMSQVIANICGIAIPVFAIVYGFREINRWRAETLGKNRIELAQRIGRLALRYQSAFAFAVSPGTFLGEYQDRSRGESEKPDETHWRDEGYARFERTRKLADILNELQEANVEAQILFRTSLAPHFQQYRDAYNRLGTVDI